MTIIPRKKFKKRQLHPLPKGVVELYALIAVLVVLIPEWLADSTINLSNVSGSLADLPMSSRAWKSLPELRLASMSLFELRCLGQRLGISGYSTDGRNLLTNRLLKRLKKFKQK